MSRVEARVTPNRVGRDWIGLAQQPESATFLLLLVAYVVTGVLSPFGADLRFILESSTYYVELCLVAVVLTMVIVAREIDLSVASMMALSACLFAVAHEHGAPMPVAIAVGIGAGAVMGAFNGWLVTVLRLPSIIVTMGTLIMYRGVAQVLAGDRSIGGFPEWFVGIDFRTVGIVPAPVLILAATAALLGVFCATSIRGRQIYQIGTNPIAALHAGIPVERIRMSLFVASGGISAIAGLLTASRLGSVRYDLASGGELQVILIVMLGGTSIYGGRGSILGTFLACWLLVVIATGMTVANIAINTQLTVFGLLLIVAIIGTNTLRARSRQGVAGGSLQGRRGRSMLAMAALLVAALAAAPFIRSRPQAQGSATLVLIPKNTGNPYFDSVSEGLTDGCRMLGCRFTIVGPATAEATSQIPFVTAQVQRRVDAILIAPNSPDGLNTVFDNARRRGVPIVSINSDMPGSQDRRDAAILPVDFRKVGPSQIELLGSLIGYQGEFAILSATTDAPDQNSWIADMKTALASNPKYARMKLVAVAYGNDDPQKSTTETEALLSNYPNLKGIISPTTVGVAAAAQVVENAHQAERISVTGLGTPNQMRRFVKNGTVRAFQLWSPYREGLLGAYFAVGMKEGRIRNRPGAQFDVPGVGHVTILRNNVIYTQSDLTVFDRSNIDQFQF